MNLASVLEGIDSGEITLRPIGEHPQITYASNVWYRASNGWKFIVFNDCNEWDYLDSFEDEQGKQPELTEEEQELLAAWEQRQASLSARVLWQRWGIPGHIKLRCILCGHLVVGGTASMPRPITCAIDGRQQCKWSGKNKVSCPEVLDPIAPKPIVPFRLPNQDENDRKFQEKLDKQRRRVPFQIITRIRKYGTVEPFYRHFLLLPWYEKKTTNFNYFVQHGKNVKSFTKIPFRLWSGKKKRTKRYWIRFKKRYGVR